MSNVIDIIDNETARGIASHINAGEFTLTEANNVLVDSVRGITEKDKEAIALYLKRVKKLDASIVYLD